MINLLKAEFFKIKKSKSVYICTMIMILFVLLSYGLIYMMDGLQKEALEAGSDSGFSLSVAVEEENGDLNLDLWDNLSILDVVQEMFGDVSAIIITVFAAIFVIGEYGHGAVKNIVGKGYPRWKIFLSKYLATTIAVVLMLILMEIASVLFGIILKGTAVLKGAFWGDFFQYSGIQLLLAAALIGLIILICELCRNMGAGISVGVCLVVFSTLLTSGIDMLFHKIDFKVSDYWIMDLVINCPLTDIDSGFAIRAIISALVWIAVVFGIGVLHFQKADIK